MDIVLRLLIKTKLPPKTLFYVVLSILSVITFGVIFLIHLISPTLSYLIVVLIVFSLSYWIYKFGYQVLGVGPNHAFSSKVPVIRIQKSANGQFRKVIRFVCISDIHNKQKDLKVPPGDVLIIAGDITSYGSLRELSDFNKWLGTLNHKYKLLVSGNHDLLLDPEMKSVEASKQAIQTFTNCTYLLDESITIEGVKIYMMPYSMQFGKRWAYQLPKDQLSKVWEKIPHDVDILVTHGPPKGIGDLTVFWKRAGCPALAKMVKKLKPKVHIFGHIHEGYGVYKEGETLYVNASSCTLLSEAKHSPIVFDVSIE